MHNLTTLKHLCFYQHTFLSPGQTGVSARDKDINTKKEQNETIIRKIPFQPLPK